jgi:subtilisin family serine protease
VKHHIVVKLRRELADGLEIPDWQHFIADKSVVREQFEPEVDRLMREAALAFWVTREYKPAAEGWNEDEQRLGLNRAYRLVLQEDYGLPPALVHQIRLVPAVEDARGIEVGSTPIPTPTLAAQASVGPSPGELIFLPYAHGLTKGRSDVRVAVVDTGVDARHRELRGKVVDGADFVNLEGLDTTEFIGDITNYDDVPEDEVGHGTHVAGIIGARGVDMDEGVAPECSIAAVRVLATMRRGSRYFGAGIVDNINPGIKWCIDVFRADVINVSLGITHVAGALPHADVIRYALSRNVTVVAATGNDGKHERYYPGALPGVCAVGAVDESGTVAGFTSYGANVMCVAPGTRVYSSYARGSYATASGTSQASPFVAGAVALMKSYALEEGVRLTNRTIVDVLRRTSDRADNRLRNERAGYGLINLADGFKFLAHALQ